MGSVFYGLTVINIRLYVALGSSVIGMMVYNVEKGKKVKKFNKVKVSSCHWGYCVFFVYDARSR